MSLVQEQPRTTSQPVPDEVLRPRRSVLSRRIALTGSFWTIATQVSINLIRLASNLILTRLLTPADFGLTAITGVIMVGLQMLSDLGIAPAIIRDERGDDQRFLNTAWTIQVVRGGLLWLFACLAAYPAAWVYEQPILVEIVPIVGLTALLSGFLSTSYHTACRHMQLGRLASIEVSGQLTGTVTMIGIALVWPTVWALVIGGLCGNALKVVLSHIVLGGPRNRFDWDPSAARTLVNFGKWITLNSSLYYLASSFDRLIVGRLMSMGQLGIYSTAYTLSQPPTLLNHHLSRSVMLPMFSETHRENPERLRAIYHRGRWYSDMLMLPTVGFVIAVAVPLVHFLYDDRYAAAGVMLQFLMINTALKCMIDPIDSCLTARGFVNHLTITHVVRTVWILVGIPVGWSLGGLYGLLTAVATVEVPVLLLMWRVLARHQLLSLRRELLGPILTVAGYGLGSALWSLLRAST